MNPLPIPSSKYHKIELDICSSQIRELAIMGAAVCTVQRLKAVQFKETPK